MTPLRFLFSFFFLSFSLLFSCDFVSNNPATAYQPNLEVTNVVFLEISCNDTILGRIEIGLFGHHALYTTENFRVLSVGSRGFGYKNGSFYRVQSTFIQGRATGLPPGTLSIYGGDFPDENLGVPPHHLPGMVSMANGGKDRNGHEFFITTSPMENLDGQYVIFGAIISGMEIIHHIQQLPRNGETPTTQVSITDSGEITNFFPSLNLAKFYSSPTIQNHQKAVEVYEKLLEQNSSAQLYHSLGKTKILIGDWPSAQNLFLRCTELPSQNENGSPDLDVIGCFFQLADLSYYQRNDPVSAFQYCKVALEKMGSPRKEAGPMTDLEFKIYDLIGVVSFYAGPKYLSEGEEALKKLILSTNESHQDYDRLLENLHFYSPQFMVEVLSTPEECSRRAQQGDQVLINFKVTAAAEVPHNEWSSQSPFQFTIGKKEVIKGVDKGVVGMCLGEKRSIKISPFYAHPTGFGGLFPANTPLTFVCELVGFV